MHPDNEIPSHETERELSLSLFHLRWRFPFPAVIEIAFYLLFFVSLSFWENTLRVPHFANRVYALRLYLLHE